jgi:predicted anti-sigma-YlaC factor YlaD
MTEHESVRAMLALAAAGMLQPEEQRRVEQHARECEMCRRDLETWAVYTQGLRKLPQPSAPEGLVQRTQERFLQERAQAADRRRSELLLGALTILGWAAGWAFWIVARSITGGTLNVFGTNLVSGLTWSVGSTVLVWMTAATAALMLGRRHEMRKFL